AFTDRMQAAAPRKPVWMVLQGFGWADIQELRDEHERQAMRRPTFEESRFMAYDAIVHSARGLLYWGTHAVEKDSPFWQDLLKLVRELADLQPVLSAPDAKVRLKITTQETWGSVDRGVRVLPKKVGKHVHLLVVNEWHEPLTYTLSGLRNSQTMCRLGAEPSEIPVRKGSFTVTIPGHGVQVLSPASP
ncbi:MAG: hypothetical protein HY706_13805, partial [Candidatus Hydrogenedentes bacterium]|nr:hypothetical protein [Candidatus Hydrogenedentota bacterium]